jgi:predicted nucleic acid-binding protein
MEFIVDGNVLFTFFWKRSVTRKLFLEPDLELYSPEFALEEINKYQEDIIRKTNLTKKRI